MINTALEARIAQYGYMRSGNHYLRALVGTNFLDRPINIWGDGSRLQPIKDRKRYPNQHCLSTLSRVQNQLNDPDLLFLYIWRDFEAVAKSMMALGARVGVPQGTTLEEFQSTPWREMTSVSEAREERWKVERHIPDDPKFGKEIRHGRSGSMGHDAWNSQLTPREYWQSHVDGWLSEALLRTNIHVVKYEDLISDLNREMTKIASFLGVEKDTFTNVEELVSMNPAGRRSS